LNDFVFGYLKKIASLTMTMTMLMLIVVVVVVVVDRLHHQFLVCLLA
jgi:hypothetical protein